MNQKAAKTCRLVAKNTPWLTIKQVKKEWHKTPWRERKRIRKKVETVFHERVG